MEAAINFKMLTSASQQLLSKHTLYSQIPHTIPQTEDKILESFFATSLGPTLNLMERHYLGQLLYGCVRNHAIIRITLELFYSASKTRLLKSKYNLYTVLCFISLYAVEEMTFEVYSRFVYAFPAYDTLSFISYLWNERVISLSLAPAWKTINNHTWVNEILVSKLMSQMGDAHILLNKLIAFEENGLTVTKSTKATTEPAPFLLTVQTPRRFSEPGKIISTDFKANPVPRSLYMKSTDEIALELKRKSRAAPIEVKQYAVAKRIAADKKKREQEIQSASESPAIIKKVGSRPSLPNSAPKFSTRMNTTAILREDAIVQKVQRDKQNEINESMISLSNVDKESARARIVQEQEMEGMLARVEQEKRHLKIRIAHEDAIVARQAKVSINREIVLEAQEARDLHRTKFMEERKAEEKSKMMHVKEIQEMKLNISLARENVVRENTQKAALVTSTSLMRQEQALKEANVERLRKTSLITQIRNLEIKVSTISDHKTELDATATSGCYLNDMSILELQERLLVSKIRTSTEAAEKRACILRGKALRVTQIAQKIQSIELARQSRKQSRTSQASIDEDELVQADLRHKVLNEDESLSELFAHLESKKMSRKASSQKGLGQGIEVLKKDYQERKEKLAAQRASLDSAIET